MPYGLNEFSMVYSQFPIPPLLLESEDDFVLLLTELRGRGFRVDAASTIFMRCGYHIRSPPFRSKVLYGNLQPPLRSNDRQDVLIGHRIKRIHALKHLY